MRNKIDLTVEALNSGDIGEIESCILELSPEFDERASSYISALSLYGILERQVNDLPVNEILKIHEDLEYFVWKKNIVLLAISKYIDLGDFKKSEETIQVLKKEDQYRGYRILLKHYAMGGNLKGYKRTLKSSDKRKEKSELVGIEREFISAFSRLNDINTTIEQIDSKKTYLYKDAITAKIDTIKVNGILELMDKYLCDAPLIFVEVYIDILVHEVNNQRAITSLVTSLVDFIKEIDPKIRVSGSNFTEKSHSLWKLGSFFIDSGLTDDCKEIVKLMNNGSSKNNLIDRLKSHADA